MYLVSFMRLEETVKLSRDLRVISQTFNEVADIMSGSVRVAESVKGLIGGSGGGDLGSKLIATGVACIAFPEPFISDIIGSTLIAAGMVIKGRRGITVIDVFKETRKTMTTLRKINMQL